MESYERWYGAGRIPVRGQCHEPMHPARFRMTAGIEGGDTEEGSEVALNATGISQMEAGKDYAHIEARPAEVKWEVTDSYTCEERPTLNQVMGENVVFRAPKTIHKDCSAIVRMTKKGEHGPPLVVVKRVAILNTKNMPPEVSISGPRRVGSGDAVILRAHASDADGDHLRYEWRQIGRRPAVTIQGRTTGESLRFRAPLTIGGNTTLTFEVSVTDIPEGRRAGQPQRVSATHSVVVTKSDHWKPVAADPKRRGLENVAAQTGGVPRLASPRDLMGKLVEAATPEKPVEGIDLVLLIDTSDSMAEDIAVVRDRTAALIAGVQSKIKGNDSSKFRIGISSYVDDRWITHLPLTPTNESLLRSKLDEVIEKIREPDQGTETVWDALYQTLEAEQWRGGNDVSRRLIYITDEGGDPGKLGHTEADVVAKAQGRGVRIEPVMIESGDNWDVDIGELRYLSNEALLITDPEKRLEFIKGKYLPKLGEVAKKNKGSTSTYHQMAAITSDLLSASGNPVERFRIFNDHFLPLRAQQDWEALITRVEGLLVLSLPDGREQMRLGLECLARKMSGNHITFLLQRDLAYRLMQKTSDTGERKEILKRHFGLLYKVTENRDGTASIDIRHIGGDDHDMLHYIESVPDPQERAALALEYFRCPGGDSIRGYYYFKIVMGLPDRAERAHLARNYCTPPIDHGIVLLNSLCREAPREKKMSLLFSRYIPLAHDLLLATPPLWGPEKIESTAGSFFDTFSNFLESKNSDTREAVINQFLDPLIASGHSQLAHWARRKKVEKIKQ